MLSLWELCPCSGTIPSVAFPAIHPFLSYVGVSHFVSSGEYLFSLLSSLLFLSASLPAPHKLTKYLILSSCFTYVFACLCICVCMYVCVCVACVYIYVCVCVCVCVCVYFGYHLPDLDAVPLRQHLSLVWSWPVRLAWPQVSSYRFLPSTGIKTHVTTPTFIYEQ